MRDAHQSSHAITIPYGSDQLQLTVSGDAYLPGVARSLAVSAPVPSLSPREMTERALQDPIGAETLGLRARAARKVVLIVDDLTRLTPISEMLPPVVDRLLAAGVPESGIELLIALGTHRPMTASEIETRFGRDMVQRFRVSNHNAFDAENLVDLGETENGTPILVNRKVVEADLVIGMGSIVPHRYCGWSGGAKIVQPGICGEATTIATHMMVTRAGVALGRTENPVRAEMELVAQRVGMDYICNAVLDPQGKCIDMVAGHVVAAHRIGVERARHVSAVSFPARAQVVVAGSHPADINLWQAGKALYAADIVVADGGVVFLVSPLHEGVGEHPEYVYLLRYSTDEIERMHRDGETHDGISVAASLAVKQLMDRATIVLVTDGLREAEFDAVSMEVIAPTDLQAALDEAVHRAGPGARVVVLPTAPETLPVLEV